jgi:hypothetical protein
VLDTFGRRPTQPDTVPMKEQKLDAQELSIRVLAPVFTAAMLLVGCDRWVDIEMPQHVPQIVVNSAFSPGHSLHVDLSLSANFYGPREYPPLPNAAVMVWEGGRLLGELEHRGDGMYELDSFEAMPGASYTLRASAPGFDDAEAHSTVPEDVPFVITVDRLPYDSYGLYDPIEVTVLLHDPPGRRNRYLFSLWSQIMHEGKLYERPVPFRLLDHSIVDHRLTVPVEDLFGGDILFEDNVFDGEVYEFKAVFLFGRWAIPSGFIGEPELLVQMSVVSEDYYEYRKSLNIRPSHGPATVYSNVINGLGVFAGMNTVEWQGPPPPKPPWQPPR